MNNFEIVSTVETITPQIARQWIGHNCQNRPVSQSHVLSLANEMKRGDWSVCGNSIVFNKSGELIDGQHRLLAIIKSDCSIESLVTQGITDDQAFMYLDQGKKRSAGDVMAASGKSKSNTRAAATKLVHKMVHFTDLHHFRLSNARIPNKTICEYENTLTEMDESIHLASKYGRFSGRSVICAALVVLLRIDEPKTKEFFKKIREGWAEYPGHPVLLLRDVLLTRRNPRLYEEVLIDLALIFKAWNLDQHGKRLKALQWKPDQRFPVPEGFSQAWR